MNLLKTLLIGAVVLFAGCGIAEDVDDCPYNAILTFRYDGDVSYDIFAEKIDRVALYVFSDDGALVSRMDFSQAQLRDYQGTTLKLNPGHYRIVCWGNAFDNTQIAPEAPRDAARVQHPDLFSGADIATNDHLYYAACDLHLPKNDIISREIAFVSAHINLEIYTRGTGGSAGRLPIYAVNGLCPQYDFDMRTLGAPASYYPAVSFDTAKNAAAAKLQVFRFSDDNPVTIDIRDPQNPAETIYTVNLKEFMAQHDIHVDGVQEATVELLVEFGDLSVDIVIPDWGAEPVGPVGPGYN